MRSYTRLLILAAFSIPLFLGTGCCVPLPTTQSPQKPVSQIIAPDSSIPPSLPGRILFHSSAKDNKPFDIYSMNTDGSNLQRLTDSPGDDIEANWSPDARQIVFSSKRDGNFEIYAMNADGSDQRRLTNNPDVDWGPSWSRDGKSIVFASNRNGTMLLFVMGDAGQNQRSVIPGVETAGWAPAWSPTRDEIVFVSDRDGDSELYLLQLGTGAVTQLTFNDRQDERPSWSPDGDQIVYMGAKERTNLFDPDEIYVMSRSGGEPRQLTDNLLGDITPAWSSDGKWIAFSRGQNDGWNIYIMPVEGGTEYRLTNDSSTWNRQPRWEP
jgi:Tol biopolymer transport system component